VKKILGSMVAALIVFSVAIPVSRAVVEASNGFAGGSGTAEDPCQITDWIQLDSVRDDLSAHFILMNNLDSATSGYGELAGSGANSGAGWLPIGTEGSPFSGSLDGQGFGIEEVHIDRADSEYVGLFGFIGGGAVVEAIGLTDCVVNGSFGTGGLVGLSAGTVNECYATGSVNADDNHTGGLMGVNFYGMLSNCYATVNVNGLRYVGGLVGYNGGGIMRNCYATGIVTGDTDVGGLVGYSLGGVTNCFWDKDTSGMPTSDGGTNKTTAELMRLQTFTDTDTIGLDEAWNMAAVGHGEIDSTAIWNIVDGRGYP